MGHKKQLEILMLNWSDTKPKNKKLNKFFKKECENICKK